MKGALPMSEVLKSNFISKVIKDMYKQKVCINKPCNIFANLLPKPRLCLDSSLMNTQTHLDYFLLSTNFDLSISHNIVLSLSKK